MNENILILGGGYAGVMAAARLARRGTAVTLVDARDGMLERIRQHQVAAGDDIAPVPYARLFRNLPVDVIRARVESIDRESKRVVTSEGSMRYDRLIYALGSESATPAGTLSVGNPLALRSALKTARSVAVIGGGLTGIETAAEIAERHPHIAVTLVDGATIGHGLSQRALRHLHAWLARQGVTVRENTRVTDVRDLGSDVVVWCGSFTMSPIAREAGLEVNAAGQILVDEHLRSTDPSIYAAGDAAFLPGYRMACAVALPMGAYVADLLSGATRDPFRMAFMIQCISLGRTDGIVQFVNADDSPKEKAITGRPAAWIKELICRFTVLSLRMEARGMKYRWPRIAEEAAA